MSEQMISPARGAPGAWLAVLRRLHFYIGLAVGPFLLVAALSGVLYALTPQLEDRLYHSALYTDNQGPALSLAAQVEAARALVGADVPVFAVRPAPQPGETTRVQFNAPRLGASESRAIFIDPVTGQARGDMTVYGTSGVLPLRTWIDQFHRNLMLGAVGRLYSELAASWLWVAALGGLTLWFIQRRRTRSHRPRGLRRVHSTAGLYLLVGLLFFSATGLTWSEWAGGNIGVMRGWWGMSTPSVSTALEPGMAMPMDEHAGHHMMAMDTGATPMQHGAMFDTALAIARAAGLDGAKVEIRPAGAADKAWTVTEVGRGWPSQVDAVAIDPRGMKVVDHVKFADYPLVAKLTRWGIDAHMGVLFGLANQLILVAVGIGLVAMTVIGYLMWWRRRPTGSRVPQATLLDAWQGLSRRSRGVTLLVLLMLGLLLPVLGVSLLGLIGWDLWLHTRRPARLSVAERA